MWRGIEDGCHTDRVEIDEDTLRDDLATLVGFGAIGGSEAEVAIQHWCAERLTSLGLEVDHWHADLEELRADPDYPGEEVEREEMWGCVAATSSDRPALILAGHVDVVPIGEVGLWESDPFTLTIRDGRWRGRGTCDMLGGVAAIFAAARAIDHRSLARPFAIHTVVAEEDGGLGTFDTLRRGHTGDACLIAEPTAGRVVAANAGSLTFRLEIRGAATHGSMRRDGVSAIGLLPRVLAAIDELETRRNADVPTLFGPLPFPISVGILNAGDWASTVPDRLVAEGRYGVRPGESFADAEAAFEHHIGQLCAQDPWLRENPIDVSWPGGRFAAGMTDPDHHFVRQVGELTGAGAAGAPYGSDLRLYVGAEIPTVQYGPGAIADAHAVDESVPIDDVVHCAEVYRDLILARCT